MGVYRGGLTSLFFFPKRKMNTAVLEYPIGGMLLNYIFNFIRLILKKHLSAMFVIVIFMVSFCLVVVRLWFFLIINMIISINQIQVIVYTQACNEDDNLSICSE